ncbi:MAG: BamA/TamA family outer membrane protein [Acidobacteria bacterium]|nr:BamA/TamA family outer membrane protein [Acidobacteriota bacterium]
MKYLTLLLLLIQAGTLTTIESVEISGIAESSVSQALRDDIQKLVGQKYDQTAVEDLTTRIESELPGYIAASKLMPGSDAERMKLVFVVVKRDTDPVRPGDPDEPPELVQLDAESNINSRYTVESAEIRGLHNVNVSDELLEELQKLVGQRLDQQAIRRIHQRISGELKSRYEVSRRVTRGEQRNHVKVIFDVKKVPWIVYRTTEPQFVYHSKQALSAGMDVGIDLDGNNRLMLGWTIRDQERLIERYRGLRVGLESTELFTDRLGLKLSVETYRQKWNAAVATALETSPDVLGTYRRRDHFAVGFTFAVDPRLKLDFGATVTVLDMEDPLAADSLTSNAGVAGIGYLATWETSGGTRHGVNAGYSVRAATNNLHSDLVYTRHFWQADYTVNTGGKNSRLSVMAGRITGDAPLFERFSLGNSETLRGWNKFDVAPIGGDRVAHGTVEIGFDPFNVFYDAGTVWTSGQPITVRHAVGFGFGWRNKTSRDRKDDDWFISLGFPISEARIRRPLLMMGVRF